MLFRTLNTLAPYAIGGLFLAALVTLLYHVVKHGGFKGMMFGARVRRTVGEVKGARQPLAKTALRVHLLDAEPEKAIGLEIVAKTFASYQMLPFSMSVEQAQKLIGHLQAAVEDAKGKASTDEHR